MNPKHLLPLLSLLATAPAQFISTMPDKVAPIDPANARSFIACPVFRNTQRQCWLASDNGTTYYIDPGTGYRPQLGFRVLVEGIVTAEPKACGGVMLNPVHITVLPDRTPDCNKILPAAGFDSPPQRNTFGYVKHADDPPLPRYAPGDVLPLPPPPYKSLHYTVYFPYNRAFLPEGTTEVIVEAAAAYIRASKPTRVTITGYAGNVLLQTHRTLTETSIIAEQRAHLVANALLQLGVDPRILTVNWNSDPVPGDGVNDPDHRKTVIDIAL